jgi:cysteinyl-tRNA synthetase
MIELYNTLTRSVDPITPLAPGHISMYTCGPTVYNAVHIGNLRTYILSDVLRRSLHASGLKVTAVMNITDVGHLTDDADQGEDKMEKGSQREGLSAKDVAAKYTSLFKKDLEALHILPPSTWCVATDHIPEQIQQVQQLIDKDVTYKTDDGIYMDTTKIDGYGALAQLDKQNIQPGARVSLGHKKHPQDFALWKFSPADVRRQMEWDAFEKKGFPGWHIECSAMAMKYLGDQFDIHVGGIDLSRVHHVNEIAQAETVTGIKPWVSHWVHGEFVLTDGERMSKSADNLLTLEALEKEGIEPLAYRYFVLQAHYRKQLHFTPKAIEAAQSGLRNLRRQVADLPESRLHDPSVNANFLAAISDDLNTPEALAVLWKAVKNQTIDQETVIALDKILGLGLHKASRDEVSASVQALLDARALAREQKNWQESDNLRDQISAAGFVVEDTDDGQHVYPS